MLHEFQFLCSAKGSRCAAAGEGNLQSKARLVDLRTLPGLEVHPVSSLDRNCWNTRGNCLCDPAAENSHPINDFGEVASARAPSINGFRWISNTSGVPARVLPGSEQDG